MNPRSVLFSILTLFAMVMDMAGGYKILLTVPGISSSQVVFFYRLGELWADAGHDVTIFRTSFLPEMNIPKIKKIKREFVMDVLKDAADQDRFRESIGIVKWHNNDSTVSVDAFKTGFWTVKNLLLDGCRLLLKNDKMLNNLKSDGRYDVIAIHMVDACSIGLAHMMDVKSTIVISTAFQLEFLAWNSGAPWPIATVPSSVLPFSQDMNVLQRLANWGAVTMLNTVYFGVVLPYATRGFRELVNPNFPSIRSLLSETQLTFINADPLIDYARPTMPNTAYIGGFMMEDAVPKNLTAEWTKIAESEAAKRHGFIIFSFGSVVNTKFMPDDIKMIFFRAFRKLPQQVIWRFVGSLPEAAGTNVHVTQWMPQADLLAHPNAAAFMTHGGFNSVLEASYAGVPLVVIPFFGDQVANVRRIERLGTGFSLDLYSLTEDNIVEAFGKVIKKGGSAGTDYGANARRLGRMLRNKPVSNRENALKWMEFLAEFKTLENLMPGSKNISIFQYFLIDLMAILGVLFGIWVVLVCACWKCFCRIICRNTSVSKPREIKEKKRDIRNYKKTK